ncbi:MAG: PAS-domain containing protein [Devosia sp.]|uniref:sensor histidine kinase n=1 Tax=Devosia sp. TaxID=1871048 RepID=UPI001A39114B|nr:PAS domain-containing sensor histidine kinase [Devosia sp.]MBL8599431.1 PAS-domain containing protein [Devosia sp.]
MRSAELSGVGSQGFSRVFGQVSPLTYAVALTAFIAASIFVTVDAFRTFEDIAERNALMQRLGAAQPLLSRQFVATVFDPVAAEVDDGAAYSGLAQRGGVAFGLALLFAVAAFRRRPVILPKSDVPYSDLLATIPFGIACWTADGRLIACNEQYRARLNAEPSDVRIGASYAASVRRFVQGGFMQLVTEDDRNRVLELHREDGTCLMIDERPLDGGGFVTLVTDVTETRRTDHLLTSIREEQKILARRYHEEKLRAEAASQSKTAFLAHLSHDIRTPLNHIIGFADLMRHETYGPLSDRYIEYVDSIRMSGERLLGFFASTLDLAELEGGRRVLNPVELDVDDLLMAVTKRFSAQAQRKGIALTLGAPALALIVADRFSLERMLGNVVDNAIRYTPPRGRVTLTAYAASDGVVLEVTDTGIGMSAERLATVSQPFAFGDAALTRDRDGAGLGLAIARTIVELSGGRLAIDSRPGLGTTVAVSLPLMDARAPAVDIAAE